MRLQCGGLARIESLPMLPARVQDVQPDLQRSRHTDPFRESSRSPLRFQFTANIQDTYSYTATVTGTGTAARPEVAVLPCLHPRHAIIPQPGKIQITAGFFGCHALSGASSSDGGSEIESRLAAAISIPSTTLPSAHHSLQ